MKVKVSKSQIDRIATHHAEGIAKKISASIRVFESIDPASPQAGSVRASMLKRLEKAKDDLFASEGG